MNRALHLLQGLFPRRSCAGPGRYEPLLLQPIEARVDSSDCDILFDPIDQFLRIATPYARILRLDDQAS